MLMAFSGDRRGAGSEPAGSMLDRSTRRGRGSEEVAVLALASAVARAPVALSRRSNLALSDFSRSTLSSSVVLSGGEVPGWWAASGELGGEPEVGAAVVASTFTADVAGRPLPKRGVMVAFVRSIVVAHSTLPLLFLLCNLALLFLGAEPVGEGQTNGAVDERGWARCAYRPTALFPILETPSIFYFPEYLLLSRSCAMGTRHATSAPYYYVARSGGIFVDPLSSKALLISGLVREQQLLCGSYIITRE
ncbi:hypothetical protein FA10DRAFT_105725 [Acaromyces ingoldii]|uniref:Uncharacterized protein n=1 Tax=Acaromyces ingoldii TaxID=215250 RepID=A0A316YLL8_9BASI|nr:hypothetical protein FA10DRAFT_105725 [Acaromyces ingoldii]PWN90139.1 hypothetical protein FA10DRAFT_105725 [Acaromyces ingoldii]